MKQKRILIIGSFNMPYGSAAALYINGLYKVFSSAGYCVKIVDECTIIVKNESYIEQVYLGTGKVSNFNEYFRYSLIKKHIESGFDYILPYNFPSFVLYNIVKYCKKNDVNIIPIVTEWYDWKNVSFLLWFVKWIDINLRMRYLHKISDGALVCSTYLKKFYAHIPVLFIPTIAETKIVQCKKNDQKNTSIIRLVYFGNPGRNKENLGEFIKILCRTKFSSHCLFDIYGITDKQFFSLFGYYASSIKFVKCYGRISNSTLIDKLKEYSFSVIYRSGNLVNKAGFPTKLGVSLSNGLPVIASDVGDIKLFVNDGIDGFLLPVGSTEKIIEKLNIIFDTLNNSKFRLKPINRNIFSYKKYIKKASNFFDKFSTKN